MILTALSTFTKSLTAMYSEQGMSQGRVIWGAVGGKGFHVQKQLKSRWWPQFFALLRSRFSSQEWDLQISVSNVRYREIKVSRFYNHIFLWSYVSPLVLLRKGAASHHTIRSAASLFKVSLCWLHIPQPLPYGICLPSNEGHEITAGGAGDSLEGEQNHPFPQVSKLHTERTVCSEKPGHSFLPPPLPLALWAPPVPSLEGNEPTSKTQIVFWQVWALNELPKRSHQVPAGEGGTQGMVHPCGGTEWSAHL